MMTQTISNLRKEYKIIMEIQAKNFLYGKHHSLTIERIHDKISIKFDQMNEQS